MSKSFILNKGKYLQEKGVLLGSQSLLNIMQEMCIICQFALKFFPIIFNETNNFNMYYETIILNS